MSARSNARLNARLNANRCARTRCTILSCRLCASEACKPPRVAVITSSSSGVTCRCLRWTQPACVCLGEWDGGRVTGSLNYCDSGTSAPAFISGASFIKLICVFFRCGQLLLLHAVSSFAPPDLPDLEQHEVLLGTRCPSCCLNCPANFTLLLHHLCYSKLAC